MVSKVIQAPVVWENQKYCVKPDCVGNPELFLKSQSGQELVAVMSKDKKCAGIVGGMEQEAREFVSSMTNPPKEIQALVESLKVVMDE